MPSNRLRNLILDNNNNNLENKDVRYLSLYFDYYKRSKNPLVKEDGYILEKLEVLVPNIENYITAPSEIKNRDILEKIHYLYHEIMEKIGYPISEKQFIQKTGDNSSFDKDANNSNKSELVLILDNLRSAFNVGSIIRLADCLGVKEIFSLGLTPDTDNKQVIKTAKDSEKYVKFTVVDNFESLFKKLKKNNYKIVAVETAKNSKNLDSYSFEKETALILGNEEIGVSQKLLNLCDEVIEIDMKGYKRSLNVSNATGIVIYEYNRQKFSEK